MGSYSQLTIGEIVFEWKYHVPTFLTFVFDEGDVFVERKEVVADPSGDEEVVADPDDLYIEKGGYRTSVARARAVLDDYGYTVPFFADIYESFRGDLNEQLKEVLRDQLGQPEGPARDEGALRGHIEAHLAASTNTAIGDLEAFTAFLRQAIATDLQMEPFLGDLVVDRGPDKLPLRVPARERLRYRRDDLADFETLHMLIFDRVNRVAANVLRPMMLFSEDYVFAYPEVLSLLYTRLVLDATSDDATVELDVSDVIETEAEIRSMHSDLAYELLHKVDVYERVFRALSSREEDVQDRYARTQVRQALAALGQTEESQAKGEALEALMAAAFSISPQLQVMQRNYSTSDEEIDIVVKNNVARPFWHGLSSPLFFVECKNWAKPVGAPEIRNFEVKLQNHAPLARVGILVAPGGFTRDAVTTVKRSSRDPYTLALVTRNDLADLAVGGESVLNWLERLLCRPI